jgi:hypothetical protein
MNRTQWMLVWLLRLTGVACVGGLVGVVMPAGTMAAAHEWLGLGAYPDAPITDYLARSTSAFYAMFGGLLLVLACDVRKYASVIRYVAWVGAVFSVAITVIDYLLALPWWWTWGEGPATLATCAAILVLQARTRKV